MIRTHGHVCTFIFHDLQAQDDHDSGTESDDEIGEYIGNLAESNGKLKFNALLVQESVTNHCYYYYGRAIVEVIHAT